MNSIYLMILLVIGWFILNKWILPKLGVSTWMSNECSLDESKKVQKEKNKSD